MDNRMKLVTHAGLDVHKHFSRISGMDASGKVIFRQRLEHADRAALRSELSSWPRSLPVVLEGTFGWGWMTDDLLSSGLQPHLTSARKTHAWRQSRSQAKNNRLDADHLAALWLERDKSWWHVWLAPPVVRAQREWLRYRKGLVETQTRCKNRVHAVLHRHGVIQPFSDLFGKQGRILLKEIMQATDARVSASGKAELSGSLAVIDQHRRLIAQVTRQWKREMCQNQETKIWKSLPGVGWVLACTIQAEVGDIGRFKNAGCLSMYAMLAPRDDDSGDEDPEAVPTGRRVSAIGRKTLRWAFQQAALSAVNKSRELRDLFNRITDQGKRQRMKGYVAVAHRLCTIGYSCVKQNRLYSEVPPARNRGAADNLKKTHSEAGGPAWAMVAAGPQGQASDPNLNEAARTG